jgi:hypothetical protein
MRAALAGLLASMSMSMAAAHEPVALGRNSHYAPAKGKTGALKIRRAATKTRNVARHKRNCRG